jgi:hypothetical protein
MPKRRQVQGVGAVVEGFFELSVHADLFEGDVESRSGLSGHHSLTGRWSWPVCSLRTGGG